jgi:hypothetical protein
VRGDVVNLRLFTRRTCCRNGRRGGSRNFRISIRVSRALAGLTPLTVFAGESVGAIASIFIHAVATRAAVLTRVRIAFVDILTSTLNQCVAWVAARADSSIMCGTSSLPDSISIIARASVGLTILVIKIVIINHRSVACVAALAINITICGTKHVSNAMNARASIGLTIWISGGFRHFQSVPFVAARAMSITICGTTSLPESIAISARASIGLTILISVGFIRIHQSVELVAVPAVNITISETKLVSSAMSARASIGLATVCISHRC